MNIPALLSWFRHYVERFYSSDEYVIRNIRLKLDHSLRVAKHTCTISRSLKLKPAARNLAQAAGILHDIGRFSQFQQYGTFNDKTSQDHAQMGYEIVLQQQELLKMLGNDQQIILDCIKYHNVITINHFTDSPFLFYLKILRDADKLDILSVVTHHYLSQGMDKNPALELELPNSRVLTPSVFTAIKKRIPVDIIHVRTLTDLKILQLSWIFDLHFKTSVDYVIENQFKEKILMSLPRSKQIRNIEMVLDKYVSEKYATFNQFSSY